MPQYRCPLSGWIDAAVEQQVRRKRAEARIAHLENHIESVAKGTHKIMVDLANPLDDPRVKALVEALSLIAVVGYSDDPKVNASIAKQTVDQARAALSALEENK